ncbi:type 1 glutamine amidotransferase [Thauera sp.]|jgi:putative glutamine amidotransferase|uniref:gamma-glutamyl-gamma-aminobutyrate hydrolase family protein n=1 Tax=Thauera sp. TaxID=1905334 RepID=UPI002A37158F|nr:type 1 glutamine amidotransferase [Thauera sp.]MDX9884292.1 type 1 glutamine amidotransferase [Thauera sp.]
MARPLIAITGPGRGAFGPRTLVAMAVRFYGGRPLQLRPGDEHGELAYHGVVVTGGHDVEPVLYAAEPEVEPNYNPERDALETAVIRDALARRLPLLGICRGAQLLNVCRGGTLHQELRSRRQKTSNRWTVLPLKTLCVDEAQQGRGTLRSLIGGARSRINSLHNQGMDRIGEGLVVSGRDLDGIVQAIEDPSADFLLGVQWHPEFLLYLRRQRALFRALVGHARVRVRT